MLLGTKERIRPYYLKWLYSRVAPDRYPEEFTRCWNYPEGQMPARVGSSPSTDAASLCSIPFTELPAKRNAGDEAFRKGQPDLLFLPASDWHARVQRSQHLIVEFAQLGHRCFFLNPHLGREFPHPYPFGAHTSARRLLPGVYELHVHLPREPVYHQRLLMPHENLTIAASLQDWLAKASSTSPEVVVSLPLWEPVARELKRRLGCRVIYDCHDLWSGFSRIHPDIVSAESDLFHLSDLVTFSSRWLMDAKLESSDHLGPKSLLIRNGVRLDDFDFLPPKPRSGRRTVGYAGALDFWFDVDTVRHAAKRHPEWDFVLFGRVEDREILTLHELPNVRLAGEVPYSSLRQHFDSVDVCMIPFRISPLTLATNPLKLYEYLACGLPVVSAPLPEVVDLGDLVYIANSPSEFVAQLENAMAENSTRRAEVRRSVAQRENWTTRCTTLSAHLRPLRQFAACP
jgi:glycosyltransferase involved in cell wall biosynthesis